MKEFPEDALANFNCLNVYAVHKNTITRVAECVKIYKGLSPDCPTDEFMGFIAQKMGKTADKV